MVVVVLAVVRAVAALRLKTVAHPPQCPTQRSAHRIVIGARHLLPLQHQNPLHSQSFDRSTMGCHDLVVVEVEVVHVDASPP